MVKITRCAIPAGTSLRAVRQVARVRNPRSLPRRDRPLKKWTRFFADAWHDLWLDNLILTSMDAVVAGRPSSFVTMPRAVILRNGTQVESPSLPHTYHCLMSRTPGCPVTRWDMVRRLAMGRRLRGDPTPERPETERENRTSAQLPPGDQVLQTGLPILQKRSF